MAPAISTISSMLCGYSSCSLLPLIGLVRMSSQLIEMSGIILSAALIWQVFQHKAGVIQDVGRYATWFWAEKLLKLVFATGCVALMLRLLWLLEPAIVHTITRVLERI